MIFRSVLVFLFYGGLCACACVLAPQYICTSMHPTNMSICYALFSYGARNCPHTRRVPLHYTLNGMHNWLCHGSLDAHQPIEFHGHGERPVAVPFLCDEPSSPIWFLDGQASRSHGPVFLCDRNQIDDRNALAALDCRVSRGDDDDLLTCPTPAPPQPIQTVFYYNQTLTQAPTPRPTSTNGGVICPPDYVGDDCNIVGCNGHGQWYGGNFGCICYPGYTNINDTLTCFEPTRCCTECRPTAPRHVALCFAYEYPRNRPYQRIDVLDTEVYLYMTGHKSEQNFLSNPPPFILDLDAAAVGLPSHKNCTVDCACTPTAESVCM